MDINEIAKAIDHTNLEADAAEEDIKKLCFEAKKYGFGGVCINPKWSALAKKELEGTGINVVAVIDWPRAGSSPEVRIFQAEKAREEGADQIDPVMDIGSFKAGDYRKVLEDLKALSSVLPCKVIIETGFLTDREIEKAALLVKESGAYCVKTSTGMDPKVDIETKAGHLEIIRKAVGPEFPIKAAGGIRTRKDAEKMIEAGANIIGTSTGVEIMEGREPEKDRGE
jgi:deoxyribose-phosphate aldolase